MEQRNDNGATVSPVTRPRSPSDDLFGSWTYDVASGVLTWSDTMFGLFGFAVHEVVPTLGLMSSHQHPQNRTVWDQQVQQAMAAGSTASIWHQMIDAQMQHRTVHTVLQAVVDGGGHPVQISGVMTDLTDRLTQERSQAVNRNLETRGLIDQAKGILMATMNVDDQAAFDLLRWHSSHMNIKLREVAAAVVSRRVKLIDTEPPLAPRERLAAVITGLAGVRAPALIAARTISDPAADVDAEQESARIGHISPASLPRTMIRAVAAAAQSISIADYNAPDQPLVYVNQAFETLTGYAAPEILGGNCRFLQGPGAPEPAVKELRAAITAGREIRTVLCNYRKDGTAFWNEVHLSAVRDATGRITHYIGYQSDVSERVQREQQLEHLALHDARTNLPNQAAAAAHLHQLSMTNDPAVQLAVARIHLSGFRGISEVDDPATVRTVLAAAAQRLQSVFLAPAYVAKLEEDVFLVAVTDSTPLEAAAEALAEPIPVDAGTVTLTVRVEALNAQQVAELADVAMGERTIRNP